MQGNVISVVVIVVGNGIGDPTLNSGKKLSSFLVKDRNPPVPSPSMDK